MRICRPSGAGALRFVCLAALLVAGCVPGSEPAAPPAPLVDPAASIDARTVVAARAVTGLVAADDRMAARVAADILSGGGNAADAAVAAAATMAVTLPSRVGPGGGGTCLVSAAGGGVEAIDFLARSPGPGPGQLLGGLAALAQRHGSRPLDALFAPAVALAADGTVVGQALASDLAAVDPVLAEDPAAAAIFVDGGRVKRAGAPLVQPALAATLAAAAAAPPTGGTWLSPIVRRSAAGTAYFAPQPEAAGPDLATLWEIVTEVEPYGPLPWDERAHLLFEAQRRGRAAGGGSGASAMAGYDPDLQTAPFVNGDGDTSFGATLAILDTEGRAVACGFSLNGMFGTGRLDPVTGGFEAAPPGAVDLVAGIAIVLDPATGQPLLVGAGADFGAGLATTMAEDLLAGRTAVQAIGYPRLAPDPGLDATVVEARMDRGVADRLTLRGHLVRSSAGMGRVSLISCEGAGPARGCVAATDPRGWGDAIAAAPGGV